MNPGIQPYLELEFGDYQTRVLKYALHYATKEWPVVPLHTITPRTNACSCYKQDDCTSPAKHPIPVNGVHAATTKEAVIHEWWRRNPMANIGIATGQGLLVIDIDPRHGGSLDALVTRFGLGETAMVRTGGGGWHLYYAYMGLLKNSTGKLGEGIDVRCANGYVVAPPSLHASGNYYAWANQLDPAPLPANMLAALLALEPKRPALPHIPALDLLPPRKAASPLTPTTATDATQLLAAAKTPPATGQPPKNERTNIPEGQRNGALVGFAGALRGRGATGETIEAALRAINALQCFPPLPDTEVHQIARSASTWERGQYSVEPLLIPQMYPLNVLLETDLPEPQWAIPHFLPAGVTLLAGKPKMGKSWFALALALAIAEGRLAFGKLSVTQGDVLYLGLEDSARRMSDRATKLLQGRPAPANFTWVGQWNLLSAGGLADLEEWLDTHPNTRLVVIDTLAKVRPVSSNNGNGYSDDYSIMTPLKRIAEQYNVAILVIHHLRKSGAPDVMDTISGTTGLTGATDCNMVLDRERGKDEAILHITGRDIEEQELTLYFNSETAQWMLHENKRGTHMSKERRELLTVLERADGPMSPTAISNKLGITSVAARKLLSSMMKDNQIGQAERGLYMLLTDAEEGEN